MKTTMSTPNRESERVEQATDFVQALLNRYASYHQHKEAMAYAGITLFGGIAGGAAVSSAWPPPHWGRYTAIFAIVASTLLWVAILTFLRFQLTRRRWAALRVAGCDRLLAGWLQEGPSRGGLALRPPTSRPPVPPTSLVANCLWGSKVAVRAVVTGESVYPSALVKAWLCQEDRGTDALKHERLILGCGWAFYLILLTSAVLRQEGLVMDGSSLPGWLSITEAVVKIVAIVAASVWTVFLFGILRQAARARLAVDKLSLERDRTGQEIEKLRRDIARLDLEAKRQAVVGISVTASQIVIAGDGSRYLRAVVEVTNRGTRSARLNYDKNGGPFTVTAVSFSRDDGQPMFGKTLSMPVLQAVDPKAAVVSTIVRAGATENLPFVCRVSGPGLYLVAFRVQVSSEEREELDTLGASPERLLSWTGKAYVVVD